MADRRLVRAEDDKKMAGVCSGIGHYLDIDPVFIRLAFVLLALSSGVGIALYILLAFIVPSETDDYVMYEKSPEDVIDPYAGHVTDKERQHNNAMLFSGIMIFAGFYFLLQNFGVSLGFLWPVMFIGVGAWVLMRNR